MKTKLDHANLKIWFSQSMTSRNINDVVSIESKGNMMSVQKGNGSAVILNFDNVNLIEEIEDKQSGESEESDDSDPDEEPHGQEAEEIMRCCICNKPITKVTKRTENAKYPTCWAKDCRKKAKQLYQNEYRKGQTNLEISEARQARIDQMKKEIDTPEKLAEYGVFAERMRLIADKYNVQLVDVKKLNDELVAGLSKKEKAQIFHMHKTPTKTPVSKPKIKPEPEQTNKPEKKLFERQPSIVKNYKITDIDAVNADIEAHKLGAIPTDAGLKYVGEEMHYASEPRTNFNPAFADGSLHDENY
ncbi:hypothetical protein LPY66_18300 [Dehalobacter sp. DCM]|uniref:hypothetical protein n=1 Tax=Dehalobacter sp. DCM TaxID=2907827 RepID=UPI003081FBF1|nr:hypothetical protein LPY66_18300 [Dehalobacter sp. DCM]